MSTHTLLTVFPNANDLLALQPEELAGVLVEIIPGVSQQSGFVIQNLTSQVFTGHGPQGYSPGISNEVTYAIGEALSWLEVQGIIMQTPGQSIPAGWMVLTRRGRQLKTRVDLEAYRKGRTLPIELLQPSLVSKVHHLFLRGDHDVAVFQAFKEVEVAVRKAGNHGPELTGRDLMTKAFNVETGPLRDKRVIKGEREAEMFLFSGAMGHAKNPSSHREVDMSREEAARLIIFASYLLNIVQQRPLPEQPEPA